MLNRSYCCYWRTQTRSYTKQVCRDKWTGSSCNIR